MRTHEKRVVYYTDPLRDDFAGTSIRRKPVGEKFPYRRRDPLWNLLAFLLYHVIAYPIVWTYARVVFGLRIRNRRALRRLRRGAFLYANHTQMLDPFLLPVAGFPRKVNPIANPDAVSIPFLRQVVLMLGCLPIPTERAAIPQFVDAVRARVAHGGHVAIYPEAHIWPYYTGIRPFTSTSFHYPVDCGAPAVAVVTTYRRRGGLIGRFTDRPAITLHVSESMWPDETLPRRQAIRELRDRVYTFMYETAAREPQVEYIQYLQEEKALKDA